MPSSKMLNLKNNCLILSTLTTLLSVVLIDPALAQQSDGVPEFELVLAISRAVERVLIVMIAGGAMYLGYRLFYITVTLQGAAEIAFKDYRVKLTNMGQGVFFAVFGACVLGYALSRPFDFKNQVILATPTDTTQPISKTTTLVEGSSVGGVAGISDAEMAEALTTIQLYVNYSPGGIPSDHDQKRAQRAVDILSSQTQTLLDRQFGAGSYLAYSRFQAEEAKPGLLERDLEATKMGTFYRNAIKFLTTPLPASP